MCVVSLSRWTLVSMCALGLAACGGDNRSHRSGTSEGGAAGSDAVSASDGSGGKIHTRAAAHAGASNEAGAVAMLPGASGSAPQDTTAHTSSAGDGSVAAGGSSGQSSTHGNTAGQPDTATQGGTTHHPISPEPGGAGAAAHTGGTSEAGSGPTVAAGGTDASVAGAGNLGAGGTGADEAPRINVGAELFTGEGSEIALPPVVIGDKPVEPALVTWTVEDPSLVTVTDDGMLRALADVGQTTLRAEVDGVEVAAVPLVLATTQPGVVIVEPEQVLGSAEPLENPGPGGLGRAAIVMSTDVGLAADDVFVAAGDVGVAGRVASVETTAQGVRVVFDLVPLTTLFSELELSETIDLPEVETTLVADEVTATAPEGPAGATEPAGMVGPSGAMGLTGAAAPTEVSAPVAAAAEDEEPTFYIGPFACQAEFDTGITPSLELKVKPSLSVVRDITVHSGQVLHSGLVARGTVTTTATGKLTLDSPSGSMNCSTTLMTPTYDAVTLFGLIDLLSVKLPVKVGFELTVQAQGRVVAAAEGSAAVTLAVGYGYDPSGGMQQVLELTPAASFSPSFTVSEDVGRFDGSARIYAGTSVVLSSVGFDFELATFDAGPVQTMSVGTPTEQLGDPAYASSYELAFTTNAASGSAINSALELVGLPKDSLNLTATSSTPLAQSPKAGFAFSAPTVVVGETTTGTMTLNQNTRQYLGADNVAGLRIYRFTNDAATLVAEFPAADTASWQYTPTASDVGTSTFGAFVMTGGLPGIPLELGDAVLTVSACPVRLQATAEGVFDCVTGLTWEADANSTAVTHDEAVTHCTSLGARLPTRTELTTIMLGDHPGASGGPYTSGCYWNEAFFSGPCAVVDPTSGQQPTYYWSSTASTVGADWWCFVDFSDGSLVDSNSMWAYTRCVK